MPREKSDICEGGTWRTGWRRFKSRNFQWMPIDDDRAILVRYCGTARRLKVPERMEDYRTDEIGPAAFNNLPHLRKVILPEGVTTIMPGAFEDCGNLKSLYLPSSLHEVYGQPFAGCNQLKRIAVHPENPVLNMVDGMLIHERDGRLIFYMGNARRLKLPDTVRILSAYAFLYATKLTAVELPQTLEQIESWAFFWIGTDRFGNTGAYAQLWKACF